MAPRKDAVPSIRLSRPPSSSSSRRRLSAAAASAHSRRRSSSSSSSSTDSSESSVMTITSTIAYGHESFATFQHKVAELLLHIGTLALPGIRITPTTRLTVTRHAGGSTHRIVLITLHTPSATTTPKTSEYVLRLPRHERTPAGALLRAVSTLHHLERHPAAASIPTPTTIAFDPDAGDPGSDCPLAHPYILQTRLRGQLLTHTYNAMTPPQRHSIVRATVALLAALERHRFERAGALVPAAPGTASVVVVDSFDVPEPAAPRAGASSIRSYPQHATRDVLLSQLETWRRHWAARTTSAGEAERAVKAIDRLLALTRELERAGCLGDDVNVLYHPGLGPEKMLVEAVAGGGGGEWRVCGVLGMEDAVVVPRVMARRVPAWLWGARGDDGDGDRVVPEDPAEAALKRDFEVAVETALPGYLGHAYRPRYRLVRRLCALAVWGVRFEEDVVGAAALVREWEQMKRGPDLGWAVKGVWG